MAIKISGSTIIDDSRNIVNAGVTTVGVLTGTDARFSGTIEANEYLGSGTKFTGIVTSIVAGANISVDQSTGQVTVTGLANTSNVISDTINTGSLNVTGLSTFAGLVDINAGGQANTFKVEDLTDNRVVIAGTGGELEDDSNLTFNGSTLSVGVALDVDGQTDLDVLNVAELATFTDNIVANGNIVGDNSTNISGISSVTSTTYYGDGSNLTSIISGVGVQTSGGYIGAGVTTLDFRGSGITTVTDPSSGFSTVFVNGTAAMSRTVGLVTAGVGQSAFTVPSYDLGNNSLDVYLNGIKLEPTEYTETNGTTITLASGAKVGDILQAFSYDVSGGNYWKLENNVLYRSNTYAPVAIGTDLQNGSSVLTVGHPGLAGTTMFVYGGARVTGVLTAASFSGNADTATALQTPRTIALTGDVVATATPFDGTSNISIAATIQPNSVGLGTDTFGDYVESISGTANEITVTGSGSETAAVTVSLPDDVTIGDSLTVTNDATVGGALTVANVVVTSTIAGPAEFIIDPAAVGDNTGLVRIKGDLRVDGEEFIVQSTTVELADHVVGVATTCASNNLLDGGGISIGAESIKKTFLFNNSTSSLESSIGLAVTSGGAFKVGSGTVLNSTTLGSGIVNSSLTSLGTLSAVTVSGDVSIADKIVHTGDTNTAIRFPSTDTVTVETAGGEAVRINSSRSLLIGPSGSPATTITAAGAASFATGAFVVESDGEISTNIHSHGHLKLDSGADFDDSTTNIFLNASTGAATFAGDVISGTDWNSGDGVLADNGGFLFIRNDSESGVVFAIQNGGNGTGGDRKASITGDGDATFAGVGYFKGNVGINRSDPDQKLNVSGCAEFTAYDSTSGSGGYYTSKGLIIGNLYDAGKSYTGSDDRTACIWQERGLDLDFATNDTLRMKISYDGIITGYSNIYANGRIIAGMDASTNTGRAYGITAQNNYDSTSNASAVFGRNYDNTGRVWCGVNSGGTTTSEISATGAATFSGSVSAVSATFDSSTTNTWFSTNTNINSVDSAWATKNATTNKWVTGLSKDATLILGTDVTSDVNVTLTGSTGAATFSSTVTCTSLTETSDQRFKKNITDANPQLADVTALGGKLRNWDWNEEAPVSEKDIRFLGLIAQEVESICPGIIHTVPRTKDGEKELTPEVVTPAVYETRTISAVLDEEGEVVEAETTEQVLVTEEQITPATYEQVDDSYKTIKTSVLIMKLLGAVTELSAKVAALEAA